MDDLRLTNIDEAIEALWDCTLELCKETYEWTGEYLGDEHADIDYKNYIINNPIVFQKPFSGEFDFGSIDFSALGDGTVPENIGISPEMFKYIYSVESGYSWGSKLPPNIVNGKDVEGRGKKTYGAGLLYHPNGKLMSDIKTNWTQEELDKLFIVKIAGSAKRVRNWAEKHNISLNQHQVDSILSGCFNFGFGFLDFEICKKIARNPNDPDIKNMWAHMSDAQGKTYPGLVKRRNLEANWYFA